MPVKRATKDGKPGYRWGTKGKVYTYKAGDEASRKRAKSRAEAQGRAVNVSGYPRGTRNR